MIRVPHKQGSYEWKLARLGIPTASNLHRIITPKTRQPSAQAVGYARQTCAEWLLGELIMDERETAFMQRGLGMEDEGIAWLELERGVTVERVGLCLTDDRKVGASPDGLIGDDGGCEVKCLAAHNHIAMLLGDYDEHVMQVQGGMYVCERQWWNLVFYHPTLPSRIHVVERDDALIADLVRVLEAFDIMVGEMQRELEAMGCVPREPKLPGPSPEVQSELDEFARLSAEQGMRDMGFEEMVDSVAKGFEPT